MLFGERIVVIGHEELCMSKEKTNNAGSRSNIKRVGKLINAVCIVLQSISVVLGFLSLFAIAVLYVYPEAVSPFLDLIDNTTLVQIINTITIDSGIPAREMNAINLFAFALSQVTLLAFFIVLRGLVKDLTANEKPFRVETAKQLRHNTFWLVLLMFWNLPAGIIILLVSFLLSYLIEYGAYLQEKADETAHIQEQVIVSLAEITENKSGQTGQHVRRVAEYTRILAEELGYPEDSLDDIRLASTMHDIGKLLVPAEILEKPGRLTDEEFETIKQHTTDGGRLLENVDGDVMHLSRTIALDHHERWDGHGYAQGKAAEDISLEGRIVAVADVYDALTSRRSYKDAWDDRAAYDEIVQNAGTQFDPQVVEAFCHRYDDINAVRQQLADK